MMDEEINRFSQQVRSLKEQIEVLQDAHMHEVARANQLAHDLAITRANLESLRSSIIAACAGTGCLNAHELRQRLDRAEAERNVLRAEVKAWREWYEEEMDINVTEPLLYQAVINAWADTDAAKAMEEKR
jgi:hypothetical protein